MNDERLAHLAALLRQRNILDAEIASVLGRPALSGHIGELIAAAVFDIELHPSATHKGSDGVFRSGPLAGRTVNVKLFGFQEGILDVKAKDPPEYYLVLTGDRRTGDNSRGGHRPLVIRHAYLLEHAALVAAGVRPGIAASVRQAHWEAAELWPRRGEKALLDVTQDQAGLLALFS